MGEGAVHLDDLQRATDGRNGTGSPRATVRQLADQITGLREELSDLVGELDRRRHEALDLKLQVRRHAREIARAAVVLVGVAAGVVWVSAWRHRRRHQTGARSGLSGAPVGRLADQPERVVAGPTVTKAIITAAARTAVATVIKKMAEGVARDVMERRRLAARDRWQEPDPPVRPQSPSTA